jgi:hypothetical protein
MLKLCLLIALISYTITYFIYRNVKPDTEPPLHIKNLVFVINSDKCDNKCYHIHHYAFLLGVLIFLMIINYLIGNKWKNFYTYFFALILGTFFSELVIFGPSIFTFIRPCFDNCKTEKYN